MTDTAIQKSMDILSTCPLFNGMSPMEIGHLLSQEGCRLVHYPAGSTIPSERGMMMLLTGSVLIEKQSADGRYLRMREVWPPQAINVSALNKFEDGATVNVCDLMEKGILSKCEHGVKILGNGTLNKKLTVRASAFSASAKEKIVAAGGKYEVI